MPAQVAEPVDRNCVTIHVAMCESIAMAAACNMQLWGHYRQLHVRPSAILLTFGPNSATAIVEPVLYMQVAATAGMQALAET